MTDLEIYEEMVRLARGGEPFALATVVESSGSSPRKPGAKMLVRREHTPVGTVGGGRVEAETITAALSSLESGRPETLSFVLTEENGFVCGGRLLIYVEPHRASPHLLMFGAGHVGKATAALAKKCGFRVTMADHRPEMTDSDALHFADEILCSSPAAAFRSLDISPETFIVIATVGHESDFAAARGALSTPARFIGLLGSTRKRVVLMETLAGEGCPAAELARIVTPVGLSIGAETPEEIAVSIVAQLVASRRGDGCTGVGAPFGGRSVAADGAVQAAPSS